MRKLNGLSAAMFSTPSNYIEARTKYHKDFQNKINETWWLASDNYEIQYEPIRGSREFVPIICRVNHAINPKTGLNLGDDFKVLNFFDMESPITMGYRFIFDNSWWIVTNSDNYNSSTKSVVIRRCNNTVKYIHDGRIIEEPCIIDYATKYSNVYYNDVVDIPQGTIDVTCQNNDNSRRITYNDRFIFGSEVYKVKVVKDYLRSETFGYNTNPLISFSMYVDIKSPYDDFESRIANTDYYNTNTSEKPVEKDGYEIVITPSQNKLIQNEEVKYKCVLYKNGKEATDVFEFIPYGVPEDCYSLNVLDGNNFIVKNKKPYLKNNLVVKCLVHNLDIYKEVEIALRGLY